MNLVEAVEEMGTVEGHVKVAAARPPAWLVKKVPDAAELTDYYRGLSPTERREATRAAEESHRKANLLLGTLSGTSLGMLAAIPAGIALERNPNRHIAIKAAPLALTLAGGALGATKIRRWRDKVTDEFYRDMANGKTMQLDPNDYAAVREYRASRVSGG